jgi:hypothetical protein
VDSYSVATSNGDTMGGETAAREYFNGLATIGLPSLTIAHVTGNAGRFPDKPFGSVFVHNLARETWAVEQIGNEEPETDPDLLRLVPNVVQLELRNKKSNNRRVSTAQFVAVSWNLDGTIDVTTDRPSSRNLVEVVADVLVDEPMTTKAIVAAIREDTGDEVKESTVRVVLMRHPLRFQVAGTGRTKTWTIR